MEKKIGVCNNPDCDLCLSREHQEIEFGEEFICRECGKPLKEYEEKKKPPKHFPLWAKILIAVVALAGLITGGLFLFKSCDSKVRITVISSDETMGTVKGSGKYELNKIIPIEANPNEGYRFVSWDDKNTKNPREILTKEDGTYTAIFEPAPKLPPLVTIKVVSSDESMGIVRGGGIFDSIITISISAEPKEGFRFVSWDDGNTANPRDVLTTENATYTAHFEPIPEKAPVPVTLVTITVVPADDAMGIVKGGGTYDSLITISIEAIANKGYEFVSWNDGNIENPREVITGRDQTFVAKFKKKGSAHVPTPTTGTILYSFGKYVGEMPNGIPEGSGKFYYSCRVQIAKHDTDNPAHYAEAGDWFDGTWGNGDIVSGALYSKDGKIKEKIFAPKRFNAYDLHNDHCLQ